VFIIAADMLGLRKPDVSRSLRGGSGSQFAQFQLGHSNYRITSPD
jgi:hypothetical protein